MKRLDSKHSPAIRSDCGNGPTPGTIPVRTAGPHPGGTQDAMARRAAVLQGCDAPNTQADAADLSYVIQDGVLRIDVSGPLDLRCVFRLLRIGQAVDDSITECVLDLTDVERVFDSGVAALLLFSKELTVRGVKTIRIDGRKLESAALQPFLM